MQRMRILLFPKTLLLLYKPVAIGGRQTQVHDGQRTSVYGSEERRLVPYMSAADTLNWLLPQMKRIRLFRQTPRLPSSRAWGPSIRTLLRRLRTGRFSGTLRCWIRTQERWCADSTSECPGLTLLGLLAL